MIAFDADTEKIRPIGTSVLDSHLGHALMQLTAWVFWRLRMQSGLPPSNQGRSSRYVSGSGQQVRLKPGGDGFFGSLIAKFGTQGWRRALGISEMLLPAIDVSRESLANAVCRRSFLAGAFLVEANLEEASFEEANLEGACLYRANLYRANLERANLEEANLERANLGEANLQGACLYRANLHRAYLEAAYLGGANLKGADLKGADLEGADLEGANLGGVSPQPGFGYRPH